MTPEERADSLITFLGVPANYQGTRAELVNWLAGFIHEAAAAERLAWTTAGLCDPTARPAREPDARGFVHYLISARPDKMTAALERLRGHADGLVGAYVPLPMDQFVAIERAMRKELADLVIDVPEPDADTNARDAQTVAIEAYRRAIRGAKS